MATKLTFTVLFLLCSMLEHVLAQPSKPCPSYNQLMAQRDIAKGRPRLFLSGGIAALKQAEDSSVEKQFGFLYKDFGCVRPPVNDRCMREYSREVFTYLDRKYGEKWRTTVRKDVLFLASLP